ncbi:MAG: LamG-like jellyroll fold domain-containing protein [Thermoleophilaceae bacterium]
MTTTPGLVGYWRLGEASGTVACDSFGLNPGSYLNGVTLGVTGAIAGDPDTAAGFDGVDDRVALPALPASVDFTVEGWQRIADSSNANDTLYGRYGNLRLMPRPGGYYAGVWLGGTEYRLEASSPANVGSWVHWALVRSGSTLLLYRNGVEVARRSDLPAAATAALSGDIGATSGSYPAKAALDDVAVYNSALSATAVQQHYAAAAAPAAPTGLRAVTGNGSVSLAWSAGPEPDLAGYDVYRATSAAGPYTRINAQHLTQPSYTDSSASNGTTYHYAVTASDTDSNESARSADLAVTPYASRYRDAVTSNGGLLAYWRLGEASGKTAADQQLARDGSYQNGVALGASGALAGDPDTAAGFDGVDDRVALPALPASVDFTVEGWQRIADSSNANDTLYGRYGNLRLMPRPGGYYAGVWLGGTEYRLEASSPANVGSWVHWALVRSGSTLLLYRNGVEVARRSDLPAAATAALGGDIGQSSGSYPAKGAIDEVAVYNAALSASTLQQHYGAAQPQIPDPVIGAAGDIACDPTDPGYNGGDGTPGRCQQKATSDLVAGTGLTGVLTLGDEQYDDATLTKFNQVYGPTWGRANSLNHPGIGNHEYLVPGAVGYFDYFNGVGNFGGPAGDRDKGYYSFDVGAWHVIELNSNCTEVSCSSGSAQETWLRSDLAASGAQCTLAFWHHPRFSSGLAGNNSNMGTLFTDLYNANADLVLTAHDHLYERFAPQTPGAVADSARGIREFVVGTGGKSLVDWGTLKANSEVRDNSTFGVLQVTLHPTSYDWKFVPIAGQSFTDSGSTSCH